VQTVGPYKSILPLVDATDAFAHAASPIQLLLPLRSCSWHLPVVRSSPTNAARTSAGAPPAARHRPS
jgi:hypothetical protein